MEEPDSHRCVIPAVNVSRQGANQSRELIKAMILGLQETMFRDSYRNSSTAIELRLVSQHLTLNRSH